MPGMDGAVLLQRVKDSYPGDARTVLSGQAERDMVVGALPEKICHRAEPGARRVMS